MATDKNPYKGWVDKNGFTTKPWKEYQKEANKIIQDLPHGKDWQAEIISRLGKGLWEFEDQGKVEYGFNRTTNKRTGEWNIKRKQKTVRVKNLKDASNSRVNRLNNANSLVDPGDLEAGKKFQKEVSSTPGRNADHILEVQTFGPAQELLEKEFKSGAITEAEYLKRKKILQSQGVGDSIHNFQDLSESANQNKKNIVEAKNKTLQKMEELNPSTRHLDDKYVKAMSLADGYKVTKTARPIKRLLKWVPYVGTGIVALNLKAQADELKAENTWQNRWQLGIASVESALEGFELATGGTGALITTPLQIGLMIAHEGIEASKPGHVKPDNDKTVKNQTEGGKYDFTTM